MPELPPDIANETIRALKDTIVPLCLTFCIVLTSHILSKMKLRRRIENFSEEYGPTIKDFLLSLLWVFRVPLRNLNNLIIARANRPSLLQLPDELILEVAEFVTTSPCPTHGSHSSSCAGWQTVRKDAAKLSMTSKRLRELLSPLLLRAVSVDESSWRRANRALKTLERSVYAYQHTRALRIELRIGHNKRARHPKDLAPRLAKTLPAFQKLSMVMLVIPNYGGHIFQRKLEVSGVSLPSVRTLVLGPGMDWLVAICPNVETVSSSDQSWSRSNVGANHNSRRPFELIRNAGLAPNLRHFELHERWSRKILWPVRKAMPHIQSLAMPGGRYVDGIVGLLSILVQFEDLKTLALSGAADLHVGFQPPRCGNSYLGPGGEEARMHVREQGRQAEMRVAKMVFLSLKGLEELWVGDCAKATVTTDDTGMVEEIQWSYEWRPRVNDRLQFHRR